jgi:hypothetical protein
MPVADMTKTTTPAARPETRWTQKIVLRQVIVVTAKPPDPA